MRLGREAAANNAAAPNIMTGIALSSWRCSAATSERVPMDIEGLCGWGGERRQQSCGVNYDGYISFWQYVRLYVPSEFASLQENCKRFFAGN